MLIDSHCHLDYTGDLNERDMLVDRARQQGVKHMVTISTWVHKWDSIREIAERYHDVTCSVGTHPHNAQHELDIQTDDLVRLSEHPKCVAIGEAGLDYHYDKSPRLDQATGFRRHIAAARITGLPLVIHARAADDDMIEILEEETKIGAFPAVLHCFSSGEKLAQIGLKLGLYLSFSGILTFKSAREIQEIAKNAPKDRILVETDAPYLAPVPHRGKTNEPAFVAHTADFLAQLRGVSGDDIRGQTGDNFHRLFSKVKNAVGETV